MLTMNEAIKRLEQIEKEIDDLKNALLEASQAIPPQDATRIFLDKCGGWEDTRTPEEIITEIYSSRTTSCRAVDLFEEEKT